MCLRPFLYILSMLTVGGHYTLYSECRRRLMVYQFGGGKVLNMFLIFY